MFSFLKKYFSKSSALQEFLPDVRGEIIPNAPLHKKTWLGVGGLAEILFIPADSEDLEFFLKHHPTVPITIIGGCSNLLIRDGGIPGIVIQLAKGFDYIKLEDDKIICGASTKNAEIARFAMENELTGAEFLCGIPGTVGGAVRMNAGAHGSSISNILEELTAIDTMGQKITMQKEEIPFDYRTNSLPSAWVFSEIVIKLSPENKEKIHERMTEYKKQRDASQPTGVRTAGSMFKNPVGLSAWKLIDKAGCRGLKEGDAMVSEKHSNFFINTGKATAQDFEVLAQKVQKKVYETSNIMLEWEVRRIGVKTKRFSSFGGK